MDFFDRNKALIITVLLFSILFLVLLNIHLSNSKKNRTTTLINLESYQPEKPDAQEKPEPVEKKPSNPNNLKTHHAFNENEAEKQENIDTRLDEIFNKNAAKSEASNEEEETRNTGDLDIDKSTSEKAIKDSQGKELSEETSFQPGSMKNSSISFSLLGRNAVVIPNPVYTCDTAGTIVVNITVNAEGLVTKTAINKASSSSTNECLVRKALAYASDAVFSKLAGRNAQLGTITYKFQE